MSWAFLKENVYFWDGSWRDIYIQNINSSDWAKYIEFVNQKYPIKWYNEKTELEHSKIDFEPIRRFWEGDRELCSTAKIFLDDLQVNCHFFDKSEIENDIDPREFNTMEHHDKLMKYLTEVSNLLKKPVIITPENFAEIVLIRIDGNEVYLEAKTNPPKWGI